SVSTRERAGRSAFLRTPLRPAQRSPARQAPRNKASEIMQAKYDLFCQLHERSFCTSRGTVSSQMLKQFLGSRVVRRQLDRFFYLGARQIRLLLLEINTREHGALDR